MKLLKRAAAALVLLGVLLGAGCGENNRERPAEAHGTRRLTYWSDLNRFTADITNLGQLPAYQELQKRLNVEIEFIHPKAGQFQDGLELILASREYPDIIQFPFFEYPGGPMKAIDYGILLPLNDVIDTYSPNLKGYLASRPDIDKMVRTGDGRYYCYPGIYGDDYLLVFTGPIVRQDFLDRLGMQRPETIGQWHSVLKAFQNKLNLPAPLVLNADNKGLVLQAFGVIDGLYVEDGRIKFGIFEEGYRQGIKTLADWYGEGLLDENYATLGGNVISQSVISGRSGIGCGNTGAGIGGWSASLKKEQGERLSPLKYPVLNQGDRPMSGQRSDPYSPYGSASITTQCENIPLAAQVLDYGYGEEGGLLFNFGIEGESYEMLDGYPTYTGKVTNDPNGRSMNQMLFYYTTPNGIGPFIRDKRYMEQFAALPEQKESILLWGQTAAAEHKLPLLALSDVESTQAAGISEKLDPYIDRMTKKMVMGIEPMEKYGEFLDACRALGAREYIEIYQKAYDRYCKQ